MIESDFTEYLTCPYCGYKDEDSSEIDDTEDGIIRCEECGEKFMYYTYTERTFSSTTFEEFYKNQIRIYKSLLEDEKYKDKKNVWKQKLEEYELKLKEETGD